MAKRGRPKGSTKSKKAPEVVAAKVAEQPPVEKSVEPEPMLSGAYLPSLQELTSMRGFIDTIEKAGMLPGYLTLDKAVVLLLKGRELGIPPMVALSKLRPAENEVTWENAELMRAIIAARGGAIVPVTNTAEECTVRAIRLRPWGKQEADFTFTINDARRQHLLDRIVMPDGTENPWARVPQACLLSRASMMAGRAMFADWIAGVSYTREEVQGFARAESKEAPAIRIEQSGAGKTVAPSTTTEQASPPASKLPPQPSRAASALELETIEVRVGGVPQSRVLGNAVTVNEGGQARTTMTAGVTAAQLSQMLALARKHESVKDLCLRSIRELLGVERVRMGFLTEPEAEAVIQRMQAQMDAVAPEEPGNGKPEEVSAEELTFDNAMEYYNRKLDECGWRDSEQKERLLGFGLDLLGVDDPSEATPLLITRAADEIDRFSRNHKTVVLAALEEAARVHKGNAA